MSTSAGFDGERHAVDTEGDTFVMENGIACAGPQGEHQLVSTQSISVRLGSTQGRVRSARGWRRKRRAPCHRQAPDAGGMERVQPLRTRTDP